MLICIACGLAAAPAAAQGRTAPDAGPGSGSLIICVVTRSGPVPMGAIVKLYSEFTSASMTESTREGGQAFFARVPVGEYKVEIRAAGYPETTTNVSVLLPNGTSRIYVELLPASEVKPGGGSSAPESPLLSPKARKELDRALEAMKRKDYKAADELLEKVIKMAPGHPDAYYLRGVIRMEQNDAAAARALWEKTIQLYPLHAQALTSLGRLFIREGNDERAISTLEQAAKADPTSYQPHEMLAIAQFGRGEFEQARQHAERGLSIADGRSPVLHYLLGMSLIRLGNAEEGRAQIEKFLAAAPDHRAAPQARQALATSAPKPVAAATPARADARESAPVAAATPAAATTPAPHPAALLPEESGVVEEIESRTIEAIAPHMTPGVTCSLPDVMSTLKRRIMALPQTLGRMAANERIELVKVGAGGERTYLLPEDFDYMVDITEPRRGILNVDETRSPKSKLVTHSNKLATSGLAALPLVFHPYYIGDYDLRCEGLTQWKGQSVWSIYFRTKPGKTGTIRTYRVSEGSFHIPLKGRAFIATGSSHLVRLETDLARAVKGLDLRAERVTVEYEPVEFKSRAQRLWLPSTAEIYTNLRGRVYHRRHSFSKYELFSVDVGDRVGAPKTPEEKQKPE